jgi:hypothetical protein
MAIFSTTLKQVFKFIAESLTYELFMNPPAAPAGGGANQFTAQYAQFGNSTQGRAGNINGPIQVNDPNNQRYIYNRNGTNQPLMNNIAGTLEYQRKIGLSSLSRYTFSPEQTQFILAHLSIHHPNIYGRLMDQGPSSNDNPPL